MSGVKTKNFQNNLLTKQLNTVIALRKLTSFEVEQGGGVFSMRPQMHLLIVKPFGTIKSSFAQKFRPVLEDDLVIRDELTKPAMLGTISKDKTYVPGLPGEIGGKVLLIDEFNNLDAFGQRALLGLLENQRIGRQLGFAVPEPARIQPNEWTDLHVKEGSIEGRVNFSCITFAMFYPKPKQNSFIEDNPQNLLGLKSRFCPNFNCPEHDELFDMLSGEPCFELEVDSNTAVRKVVVAKEPYIKYVEWFRDFSKAFSEEGSTKKILGPQQIGFLSRILSDILRFSAHEALSNLNSDELVLHLNDPKLLIKQGKDWAEQLLRQYIYDEGAGTFEQFVELANRQPGKTKGFYASKLNKSPRQIQRWKRRLEELRPKIESCVVG